MNHLPLLDLMAETGCNSLFMGFETINEKALAEVGKRQNRGGVQPADRGDPRRGIMVNASMVFGLDHDDASMFKTTMKWLVANKVETMTGHILTPYPGTVLYDRLDCRGPHHRQGLLPLQHLQRRLLAVAAHPGAVT